MSSSKLRIGLVQIAVGANKQENISNVLTLIDQTDNANLVVRKRRVKMFDADF